MLYFMVKAVVKAVVKGLLEGLSKGGRAYDGNGHYVNRGWHM